jgi:hypothetical protein
MDRSHRSGDPGIRAENTDLLLIGYWTASSFLNLTH